MEILKNIFGDKALTFDEFISAIDGEKTIKLANLADGKYVDKEKFDKKVVELQEANNTIKQLQNENVDIERMKSTIADYRAKEQKRINEEKAAQKNASYKARFSPLKGNNKFLNEGTENWIFNEFVKALDSDENIGKSDAEIYEFVTKDKNIYISPNQQFISPPVGSNIEIKGDKAYMDKFYEGNPFYKK